MKQKMSNRQIWFGVTLGIFGAWMWGFAGAACAEEAAAKFKENETSFYSDFFDQNVYSEGMNQIDLGRWQRKISGKKLPSKNVNVFDEVPDSGFFTNRQGRERLSTAALEKGYQETSGPDLTKPLEVIAAEQRGIYPRFLAKDARGNEYLLEFDPQGNLELMTGAELVASRFYHALGYFVPQYTILLIKLDQFRAGPGATTWEDTGFKKTLSQKRLEEYLMVLPQNKESLYRASACKVIKGGYYGSFSFESRRKDDPADLVNHRDRREIRALGIFASWLNHYDLRESDTLDISTREGRPTSLTHFLNNFDGALGATREGPKAPMLGFEYAVDYGETFKSVLALGLREKPWQKKWRLAGDPNPNQSERSGDWGRPNYRSGKKMNSLGEKNQGSPAVGYFTNDLFDPEHYKTLFPYEAFRLVTRADGFWAAKLLMSFSDEDIRAMVRAGQYSDPKDAETLAKTLIERRDKIARTWFLHSNPLDGFALSGGKLSFKDLAVKYGFASQEGTVYHVEVMGKWREEKTAQFETKETIVSIQPEWVSTGGEARMMIRLSRASSKELSPAVTIQLNAAGIQGIRHQD